MGPPLKLLEDSSDEEPASESFGINKSYAERYEVWRNKEELQKLKDLSKEISSSSSESEEEEEPEIEKDFLKTLSLLKSKDPRIYDEKTEFFKEETVPKTPKKKKEKIMTEKDMMRNIVLERDGIFDDDVHLSVPLQTKEEEEELRKNMIRAAYQDSDDDDVLELNPITKTKEEEEKEEADHKLWLETEEDMLYLNKCWNDPKIDEDEKFLRDYILNKNYITGDKPDYIPSYDEITGDIDLLEEDKKDLEKQEMFEHKYNFRFEEPDEEFIKSYPRTVGDSLRRENNKRKQKREEYAERKRKEKEQKREELKRLKALKRKEIEDKFLKLKEASGQDELNFDESDIESDFDPDKHDQKMREMFNDDYYNVEEEQKPEFQYDEEIDDENWDRWTRDQMGYSQKCMGEKDENGEESSAEEEDEPKNDLKSRFELEMIDSTTSNKQKKGRKKSLFAKIVSQKKPLYDPNGKSFDEYLDEYYKLDYEDIVGDMPVRFKYRKVVPNDFGLTVDEILAAQDRELNRWCSVKKTCQYRDDRDEIYDVQAFKKKAQNLEAKKKILASVYAPPEEEKIPQASADNPDEVATKKKRKKKRSKKKKTTENQDTVENENSEKNGDLPDDNTNSDRCQKSEVNDLPKRKKKKKKSLTNGGHENSVSDPHKNAYGFIEEDMQRNAFDNELNLERSQTNQSVVVNGKKKKKNKSKALEENDSIPDSEFYVEPDEMNENSQSITKKKRKKSQTVEENISTVERHSVHQMNEDVITKKKKRKFESFEKDSSSCFAEYDENDGAEAKNSLNLVKKRKLQSVDKTDLPSVKQPKNVSREKTNTSLNQQNTTKSIYAENTMANDSNRRKKKKKQKNNQQSFVSQLSNKPNFYSQKFQFNKKQIDSNAVQIVDNSGKKIVSSNTRLSAFEINPKKFQNKLKYGKNQT